MGDPTRAAGPWAEGEGEGEGMPNHQLKSTMLYGSIVRLSIFSGVSGGR